MSEKSFRYQKKDHVLVIDLSSSPDRPPGKSRRSADLRELCDEVAWDEEVHVVIIGDTGEKAFSGETDLIKAVSVGELEGETEPPPLAEPVSKLDRPVIA